MKTGFLITARLNSKRLKRKVLLDIDGDTILDKVIKRCKCVSNIDEIILCTSINSQDEELITVAEKHGIKYFQGPENDVLVRLADAANKYKVDRFLSITADNPLHSVEAAEQIIDFDNGKDFDFIFTFNLPTGLAPYFIKTKALLIVNYMKKATDTEIWGPFVNQPSFFKIGNLFVTQELLKPSLRITCDYEEDYRFIKKIHELSNKSLPNISDIRYLFINNKEIFEINKNHKQRKLNENTISNINKQFLLSRNLGLDFMKRNNIVLFPGQHEKTIIL